MKMCGNVYGLETSLNENTWGLVHGLRFGFVSPGIVDFLELFHQHVLLGILSLFYRFKGY